MRGVKIGSIIIPVASLLLCQKYPNSSSDFCNLFPLYEDTSLSITKPQAVYEYRRPRILTIDVSHDVGADLVKKCKTEIERINRKISCGSQIHVDYDKKRMQLKVTVMSASPEHRAILIELTLRHLPTNAEILENSTESMEESSITKSTLVATSREIRLLETHMKKTNISLTEMGEFTIEQTQTDKLSAKMINLLKH